MAEERKRRKIKPYTKYWESLANAELRAAYGTPIPCKTCGHPRLRGYCCTNCWESDPDGRA